MLLQKSKQVNYLGVWTLYLREVRRFLAIPGQTVVAPIINVTLFVTVFSLSLRPSITLAGLGEFEMILFVVPGLIIMNVLQGSYMNNSSSIVLAKTFGSIFDLLVAPLSAAEVLLALTCAGITRGLLIAGVTLVTVSLLLPITIYSLPALFLFICLGSACMALAGTISGIWADNFERLSLVSLLLITPLTFLSGTFYPVSSLPSQLQPLLNFNPFFHAINGFRFAVIGYTDTPLLYSVAALCSVLASLALLGFWVLKSGYKLRS